MVAKVDEEKEGGGEEAVIDAKEKEEACEKEVTEKEEAVEPKADSSPYARKTYTCGMYIGLFFHLYDVVSDFQYHFEVPFANVDLKNSQLTFVIFPMAYLLLKYCTGKEDYPGE